MIVRPRRTPAGNAAVIAGCCLVVLVTTADTAIAQASRGGNVTPGDAPATTELNLDTTSSVAEPDGTDSLVVPSGDDPDPPTETLRTGPATLDAPPSASSGSELTVSWTGPDNQGDYIAIAAPTEPGNRQESYKYTNQGTPLAVKVPDAPGQYELRYIQGQSRSILQRQPLEVTAVGATLDAPATAASGSQLAVSWTGPDNQGDYIAIAAPAEPGNRQESYKYTNQGTPLAVKVPDAPGQYELRYIQGQSRSILQRQPLEVTAVTAALDAPATAPSGSQLAVSWTGPDNQGDYIAIAAPAEPGNRQESYKYTNQGTPLAVKVPDAPGQYELRYIQGQSRSILQRQPLEVTAVTATLDAPASAASGSQLTVSWTGPDNQGDYIAIAAPAEPGNRQESYKYTNQGTPLAVKVPDAPGQYELRYIQGQSKTILQRRPLTVTE